MDTPEQPAPDALLPIAVPDFPPPAANSKLTPRVVQIICSVLQTGNFLAVAARTANIDESSLHGWLRRGRDDIENGLESPYTILSRCVADAEASCEAALVAAAMAGVQKDPRVALEMLGRRYKRWSPKASVETRGQVDIVAELRRLVQVDDSDEILIGPDSRPYLPPSERKPVPALPPGAAEREA